MSDCERQRRRTAQHTTAAPVCKAVGFFSFQCRSTLGTSSMYIFILVDNERNAMRQSVHKKSTSEKCSQSSSGLRILMHLVHNSQMKRNATVSGEFDLLFYFLPQHSGKCETVACGNYTDSVSDPRNQRHCKSMQDYLTEKPLSRSTATLAFPSVSQKIRAAEYQLT